MAEPTLNLLSTYIGAETIRSNCEYYLFRTTSGVSPPVALVLSEFLALTVAAICLRREPSEALSESPDLRCLQKLLRYAIPAALDLLARLICLAVADSTSSNLLQLFITSRIPATSILHHLWIKKQRNGSAWSSLIWVCLGLFMLKIPPGHESKGLFVTFVAGFAVAAVTAFSNVASETLSKSGMFWESQFWLYAWGTLFSVFSYPLTSAMSTIPLQGTEGQEPASMENLVFLIIYIVTTVVVRITTGVILRRKDNLTILVATTTALLISATTLYYISTALRATNMTSWTIIGGLVTAIATWRYYHYIGHGTNQYDSVSVDEYRDAIPLHTYTLVPAIPRSIQEADAAEKQECIPEIADAESDVDFLLSNDEALSFTEVFNATTFGLLPSALPTLKRLQMGVRSVFIFLLPSFMPFASSEIASPSKKLHLTAWLDGLRGVASLCVGFQHTIIYEFPRGLNGWNGTTQNMFIQLPWIRLFLAGHPMVAIFFVVSGFSLSYGPLKRIGANDFSGMASSLSSSVLRRPFRLYLPCIPVTFITMLTVYFRLDGGKLGVGVWPFPNQFWHWANDLIYMMNPFTTIDLAHWQKLCSPYLPNIWTIPLEFRGSMVVYLFLIACAQMKAPVRIAITTSMCAFFLYYVVWDIFLFLGGLVLADLHYIRTDKLNAVIENNISSKDRTTGGFSITGLLSVRQWTALFRKLTTENALHNIYWILHFLLAWYILSMQGWVNYPIGQGDPGFIFLWSLTPSQYTVDPHFYRFWPAIGAIYLVYILDRCTLLQKIFTTRLAQYLGKISFSIYLVHFYIFMVLGQPLLGQFWGLTGKDTDAGYFWGFVMAYVIIFSVTVWVADVFTRLVDENCVKFSKWVYQQLVTLSIE